MSAVLLLLLLLLMKSTRRAELIVHHLQPRRVQRWAGQVNRGLRVRQGQTARAIREAQNPATASRSHGIHGALDQYRVFFSLYSSLENSAASVHALSRCTRARSGLAPRRLRPAGERPRGFDLLKSTFH